MSTRVERHIIVSSKKLERFCALCKNLHNVVLYRLRQAYIYKIDQPSEYETSKELQDSDDVDYRALPAQTSQHIIKQVYREWRSFWANVKAYQKHPGKFSGRPKMPGYKRKLYMGIFSNQQAKIKNSLILFPEKAELSPIRTKVEKLQQVRIVPRASCFVVEVVYEKEVQRADVDESKHLAVDLGLNNLATCVSDVGEAPFIVNGRPVKSINQGYNKRRSQLQSKLQAPRRTSRQLEVMARKRNQRVDDYMHKASRCIINYCIKHRIGTIIVGYNQGWKEEINLGRVNNQKFVSVPHLRLVQMLQYKAEDVGIKVVVHEESYTSKVDHLAGETMKHHDSYAGKRVKRGLFRSSVGACINADVNGALGIGRKVLGDPWVTRVADRGVRGLMPIVIQPNGMKCDKELNVREYHECLS